MEKLHITSILLNVDFSSILASPAYPLTRRTRKATRVKKAIEVLASANKPYITATYSLLCTILLAKARTSMASLHPPLT